MRGMTVRHFSKWGWLGIFKEVGWERRSESWERVFFCLIICFFSALDWNDRTSTQKQTEQKKKKRRKFKEGVSLYHRRVCLDQRTRLMSPSTYVSSSLGLIPALSFTLHVDSYKCRQLQEMRDGIPQDCNTSPGECSDLHGSSHGLPPHGPAGGRKGPCWSHWKRGILSNKRRN